MDAKIGDWVVTPRVGKAVEINALWINALQTMAGFAGVLARPSEGYEKLADKAKRNFQKFWNPERQCCYDVIDTPSGENDGLLRPNQIFAVSLRVSPLTPGQQKAVVDIVAQQLLTSHGLRSLGPVRAGLRRNIGLGVGRENAIPPTIKEPCGDGSSVRLRWPIIVSTRMRQQPRASWNRSGGPLAAGGWARSARFLTATRHFVRPGAWRRRGP